MGTKFTMPSGKYECKEWIKYLTKKVLWIEHASMLSMLKGDLIEAKQLRDKARENLLLLNFYQQLASGRIADFFKHEPRSTWKKKRG